MKQTREKKRKSKAREEGLVMLVVLLILLMVTATGTFAAYATSMDIRAAGHTRLGMQTRNLAAASLLSMADYTEREGVDIVLKTIRQNQTNRRLDLTGVEPAPFPPDKDGARFYADDLAMGGINPAPAGLFGTRDVHSPLAFVDVYDIHAFMLPIAGQRADGQSPFRFVRLTFTGRARARVPAGAGAFATQLETAGDARAHILAGPVYLTF